MLWWSKGIRIHVWNTYPSTRFILSINHLIRIGTRIIIHLAINVHWLSGISFLALHQEVLLLREHGL